jgi:hypothetical protein
MILYSILFLTYFFAQIFTEKTPIRIGGVFSTLNENNEKSAPGIQKTAAFLMAIDELRKLHPINVTVTNSYYSFTSGITAALEIKNSFNSLGVHGCIGSSVEELNSALAYIFKDTDTAQIAFGDYDSLFSHTEYPDFASIYPSPASQGYAIASILCDYYNIRRFVVVYTTDMYGLDNYNEFHYKIINDCGGGGGGAILQEIKLIPNDHEIYKKMDFYIDAAKKYDPRIFVLLLKDQNIAAEFITRAYNKGILNANSFTWGTLEITNSKLLDKVAANILTTIGYFGLSNAESDWKYYDKGREFIKKIQSLSSTVKSKKKDGDGHYIYIINDIDVGANYSKYKFDDIDPYIAYTYDATYSLVYSILNLTGHNVSLFLNGTNIIDTFEDKVDFEGITGQISIIQRNGMKFRDKGIKYSIVNFNGSLFNRLGTYEDRFIICNTSFYLPGGCNAIAYGTPGNVIPTDAPHPYTKYMPESMKGVSFFFAIFLLLNISMYSAMMVIYRKNKILKVSQYIISWAILFFGIFAALNIILNVYDPSTGICYSRYIFGHMTFLGVVVLFIKSLRVYIIVNLSKLKKIKITNKHTLYVILGFFVMLLFYLLGVIVFDTIYVDKITKTFINGQIIYEPFCNNYNLVDYILWALESSILIITAKIAYDTRNIPDTINESKLIALCIFLITIIAIIGMIFTQIMNFEPYENSFIVSVCFFIAELSYLTIYFGPKLHLLYNGADLDKKFNIVYKNGSKKVLVMNNNESYEDDGGGDIEKIKHKYLLGEPKTNIECETLINILNNIKIKLNSKDILINSSSVGTSNNKNQHSENRVSVDNRHSIDNRHSVENHDTTNTNTTSIMVKKSFYLGDVSHLTPMS